MSTEGRRENMRWASFSEDELWVLDFVFGRPFLQLGKPGKAMQIEVHEELCRRTEKDSRPWESHPAGCSCWDCNPHPCSDCGEPIGGDPAVNMRCAACLMRHFRVLP